MSSQAVGGAVGHNPISIIIPATGSLVQTAVLLGMPAVLKKNKTAGAGRRRYVWIFYPPKRYGIVIY